MISRKLWTWTAVIGSLLACSLWMAAPAAAGGTDGSWQVAQAPQQGGPPGMQQGGQRGQQPPQQGGQPPAGAPQAPGGNNSCVQSYQRCVMMCAGNGTCVNNCNIGYAVCQQQGGGS